MPSGRPAPQRHGGYVWFPADVDNMTPEKRVGPPAVGAVHEGKARILRRETPEGYRDRDIGG